MTILEISNLLLWGVVSVMAVVIFALIRQIGVLLERVAPAGALSVNKKLEAGTDAPELSLQTIQGELVTIGGVQKEGKAQLLFFSSPDCPVCKTLMPAVSSMAKQESQIVNLVIASDGDSHDHKQYMKEHGLTEYPYVVSELLGKQYGVAKLPYGVLIDESGKIASMGIINSREHLDSLFEAKDHKVASIQEYIKTKAS